MSLHLTRRCPQCDRELVYRSADSFGRARRRNSKCTQCAQQKIPELETKVIAKYNEGLSNREIAAALGCHHSRVGYFLKKNGLIPHIRRGTPPEPVDSEHSRCRQCDGVQPNDQFPFVRSRIDGRRLSICLTCRASDARAAISASPRAYFAEREGRMRRGERGASRRRARFRFDLPDGYLLALWKWQQGLCFYTGKLMTMALGEGINPFGVSIDRVDPVDHYAVGNVVLCCCRVNSVKSDLTLDELAEWIPSWHRQVVERLPLLAAEVTAADDAWPRNAAGSRLPVWIVERRSRIAELVALRERIGPICAQVAEGDF
jgi:hypothetical protein